MNKLISCLLCVCLFISACTTGRISGSTTPIATVNPPVVMDIYTPLEPVELAPLETVPAVSVEPTTGPAPVFIQSGTTFIAPVDGLFFTLPVASFILAESEAMEGRYNASLTAQRELDFQRVRLTEETWRIRLNGDRARFLIIHEGDQREINRLMELVESSMLKDKDFPWTTVFVGIGTLLVGVITGFIAGILMSR